MMRWSRTLVAALWIVALLPVGSGAQSSVAGLGVRYAIPYESLADTHEPGYGITWTSLGDLGSTWASLRDPNVS